MTRNNCMFMIPHELSGVGRVCILFKDGCNELGKHCLGYRPHNAESRKQLADAIAEKRKAKEEGGAE